MTSACANQRGVTAPARTREEQSGQRSAARRLDGRAMRSAAPALWSLSSSAASEAPRCAPRSSRSASERVQPSRVICRRVPSRASAGPVPSRASAGISRGAAQYLRPWLGHKGVQPWVHRALRPSDGSQAPQVHTRHYNRTVPARPNGNVVRFQVWVHWVTLWLT